MEVTGYYRPLLVKSLGCESWLVGVWVGFFFFFLLGCVCFGGFFFFFLLTLKSAKNLPAKFEENSKSHGLWQQLSQLETFICIFVSLPVVQFVTT